MLTSDRMWKAKLAVLGTTPLQRSQSLACQVCEVAAAAVVADEDMQRCVARNQLSKVWVFGSGFRVSGLWCMVWGLGSWLVPG